MVRELETLVAGALVVAATCAADAAPPDWLAGHWCATSGEEMIEELWLPPHGSLAVGIARTLSGGETVAFEYLRIDEIEGRLAYVAQPGGRPPTTFGMTAAGEQWVRFENPAHDFPQRIEYRREGEALHAEIAGPGDDGKEVVIPFDFRPCTPGRNRGDGA